MSEQANTSFPQPPIGWTLEKNLWRGACISGWDAINERGERRCLLAWRPSREVTAFDARSIYGVLSLFRSCRHPHLLAVREILGVSDQTEAGASREIWAECDSVAMTLRQRLNAPDWPQRSLQRRYAMIAGICRGLTALHRLGAVHGDLRPGTVLVGTRGETILGPPERRAAIAAGPSDDSFRIARPHNPRYCAPEVLEGSSRPIVQSDIYSLALVIYDVLTHPAATPEIFPEVFEGLEPDDIREMAFSDDTGDRGMPPLWTRWRDCHMRGAEPEAAHKFSPTKLPKAFSALLHIMLSRNPGSRPDSMVTTRRALLAATGEPIFESKALEGSGGGNAAAAPARQTRPADGGVETGSAAPSTGGVAAAAGGPAAIRINLPDGVNAAQRLAEASPRRWRVAQAPEQMAASGGGEGVVPQIGVPPSAPVARATGSLPYGQNELDGAGFKGRVVASLPPSDDTIKEQPADLPPSG
jgi:hypothetical protein